MTRNAEIVKSIGAMRWLSSLLLIAMVLFANSIIAQAPAQPTIGGSVFGGGRMANVNGNAFVEMKNGDVQKSIFGGNDIAGRTGNGTSSFVPVAEATAEQLSAGTQVYGVYVTGGTVTENVFGGANGYYACHEAETTAVDGYASISYTGSNFTDENVVSEPKKIPAINATSVFIDGGRMANVYGGGNLAPVGYGNIAASAVQKTTVNLHQGTISHNAFTGGNMASVYVPASLVVDNTITEGSTYASLSIADGVYGGNDKSGQVVINRSATFKASDGTTDVPTTSTYLRIKGAPLIGAVYGAGNGEYDYTVSTTEHPTWNVCGFSAPDQSAGSFVDINTTGGYIGTVCGGGNSASVGGNTYVLLNTKTESVADNGHDGHHVGTIYGGCNKANVTGNTTVALAQAKVETIYGGCNISGDITGTANVTVADGLVTQNVFGGANGYYGCSGANGYYGSDFEGDDITVSTSMKMPTVKTTNVSITGGQIGVENTSIAAVYGGGNFASVSNSNERNGVASCSIEGGTINGSVYGGGNMASVYGYTNFEISGGTINGNVYGGNDKAGSVTGDGRNGNSSDAAWSVTDEGTHANYSLSSSNAASYVLLTGAPAINGSVFGGGNGDYDYTDSWNVCNLDKPVQTSAFVDVNINCDGHIDFVFAGGNNATVGSTTSIIESSADAVATVFFNVKAEPSDENATCSATNVSSIFGGNNKAQMNIVPNIDLQQGRVGNIYGGGNMGVMNGYNTHIVQGAPLSTYVRVPSDLVEIKENIYGGCKAADVVNETYVILDRGHVTGKIFGANDIAGNVGTANVIIDGVSVVNEVYGGGNGWYCYEVDPDDQTKKKVGSFTGLAGRPTTNTANVEVRGAAKIHQNIYGGGLAGDCVNTNVNLNLTDNGETNDDNGILYGMVFGGGRGDVDNIGKKANSTCVTNTCVNDAPVWQEHVGNVTGMATLNINTIGSMTTETVNGKKTRNAIFGGGHAGDVENAVVNLNNTCKAHIPSIYGGCLASDLKGTTTMNIFDVSGAPEIPTNYTSNVDTLYGGNDYSGKTYRTRMYVNNGTFQHVFGAGNGEYDYSSLGSCADSVPYSMDVDVTYNGGTFLGTVYGGGNMGLVGNRDLNSLNIQESDIGSITVNIHGGHFERHVFTGARGSTDMVARYFETAGTTKKNVDNQVLGHQLAYASKQLNMDGGVVDFSVYGGSEAVDDGYFYECKDKTQDLTTLRPSSILNIVGGEIKKSVYGGGYMGNIYGSVYVNIGIDAVNDSPVWTKMYGSTTFTSRKPTNLTKSRLTLGASVYNASDWGEAGDNAYFNTRGVFGGETNILVDGQGYYTSLTDQANISLPGMDIAYSIIGAGTSTDGGDVNRLITIRHYGDYNCPNPSKSLYSIQRADKVILDHVYLDLYGEQDAFSAYASPSYSFCRIDTLLFRIDNVIMIESPAIYIGNLVSHRDNEVYHINPGTNPDGIIHHYTNTQIDGGSGSEVVSNDLLDNLVGCGNGSCENVGICSKLPTDRGGQGRIAAANVLMMKNGSYMKISPFVDLTGSSTNGPDGLDDAGHSFGHVYGYMYLLAQDATMSYVYADFKGTPSNGTDARGTYDGGFISPCSCENNGTFSNEIDYQNVLDNNNTSTTTSDDIYYRSWKCGTNQGTRSRHITLIANATPDNILNHSLAGEEDARTMNLITAPNTSSNNITIPENMAYAVATLELPPADGGNFYVINSVIIDQDNGGQLNLVDQAYYADGTSGKVLQYATPISTLSSIAADPNYSFGLSFTSSRQGNFDMSSTCWTSNLEQPITAAVTGIFSRTINSNSQCWHRTLISGNQFLTGANGFISNPVISGARGAIPSLDMYLTYCTNITSTITRDVLFTMYEFTSNGTYVGPVEVRVTINTVIKDFDDIEAPVLAMYNDGISNQYVRKVTIPASFLQRDIYLEGIEWYRNTGSAMNEHARLNLQDTNASITSNADFSIVVTPTESASENINNTLGWYHIATRNIDVFDVANKDYHATVGGYIGTNSSGHHENYNSWNYDGEGEAATHNQPPTTSSSQLDPNGHDQLHSDSYQVTNMGNGTDGKGLWIGTLDGRSTAAINVKLNFDGLRYYFDQFGLDNNGNDKSLGWVILKFHYYNTKKEGNGTFNLKIKLRTRYQGDTIYLAPGESLTYTDTGSRQVTVHSYASQLPSRHSGATVNDVAQYIRSDKADIKNNPDLYLTNLVDAMNIYDEGDVLDVIKTITVSDGVRPVTINGEGSSTIQIIRYSGSHYKFPSLACANYDPLIHVTGEGKLSLKNVWFNGSGCTRVKVATNSTTTPTGNDRIILNHADSIYHDKNPRLLTVLPSKSPVILVSNGGNLNFVENVRVSNNFNFAKEGDENYIGGGAIALMRSPSTSTTTYEHPILILNNNSDIYDNLVVDWHSATASNPPPATPLNYGGGIYVDGGQVTLGAGKEDITVKVKRNFYLKNTNIVSNAGITTRNVTTLDQTNGTTSSSTFKVYHLDTTGTHATNFALSNIYLCRKPYENIAESTENGNRNADKIRWDSHSDIVYYQSSFSDSSSVGISKWFPGYEPRDGKSRDTIVVARCGKANATLVDKVYQSNVFFNDSTYIPTESGAVATSSASASPAFVLKDAPNFIGNTGTYQDQVYIFYHYTVNQYNIYFHRCATFGKGVYQLSEDLCHNVPVNHLDCADRNIVTYRWNHSATCSGNTDSLFFMVGGGFFPYHYQWYEKKTTTDPETSATTTTTTLLRDRLTYGYSDISNVTIDANEGLRKKSEHDSLVMVEMALAPGEVSKDFTYYVTATDLTGHCSVDQNIHVKVLQQVDKTSYTDETNWLSHGNTYKFAVDSAGIDSNSFNDPTLGQTNALGSTRSSTRAVEPYYLRIYKLYTLSPDVYPNGIEDVVSVRQQIGIDNEGNPIYSDVTNNAYCPGDVVNLQPVLKTANQSKYNFIMWDFDASAEQNANFVVGNDPSRNKPIAYYEPGDYWWQVVTTKPYHYREDYYGNVTIENDSALAWLISVVNGYNGQEAHTFRFDKININPTVDIDMSAHKWTPLGNQNNNFEGTIFSQDTNEDGIANHKITGIIANESSIPTMGIFGYTDNAKISNLSFGDIFIKGNTYVGGLVGQSTYNTEIRKVNFAAQYDGENRNTNSYGATLVGTNCIGGLISTASNTKVDNCSITDMKLMGNCVYVGGVAGKATQGDNQAAISSNTFTNNSATAVDQSRLSALYAGGAVGYVEQASKNGLFGRKVSNPTHIMNNYIEFQSGDMSHHVGGLVGNAADVDIRNNYVYGTIKGLENMGGLVAVSGYNVNIDHCYYVSGSANSAVGLDEYGSAHDVTTFYGNGNQVRLDDRVGGYTNLTRALNGWVKRNNEDGNTYRAWRSDLENENNGYPVFGTPDMITIYDTLVQTVCDLFEWDGIELNESGVYSVHIVDSLDYLDSTATLILTVNYHDETSLVDSVELFSGYEGYGFSYSAQQLMMMIANNRGAMSLSLTDTLQTINGCDSIVNLTLYFYSDNVEVDEAEQSLTQVKVYPNPTRGIVHVEGSDIKNVEVYDATSRCLLRKEVNGDETILDLTNKSTGSYYIRVNTAKGSVVKKLIKK